MFYRVAEAGGEVCDQVGNCLSKEFGTVIPMISFVWSIFSVVLEAMDSLRLDSKLQSLAFILPNFMARTLILILIQSFLQAYWILFFMVMVIGSNALIVFKFDSLSCLKSVVPSKLREMASITLPDHKNKIVSALVSFPLCLLVSEDITKSERGVLESAEARRQAEKYLSIFSLTNMMVFLPLSYMFVYLITSGTLNTDPNVILSTSQMYNIYLYIALPLAALAVIASLLLLLSPMLNKKLKTAIRVLIIAATIIYPTVAGMTMIERSPTSVLIFVQNKHCVTIFEGHTNTNQAFNITQSEINKDFIRRNIEIRFESQKFYELADKENVHIKETTDIKVEELKDQFGRKVCFFCAAESNLCRRTLFSLGSDDCDVEQCPSSLYSWKEWTLWSPAKCPDACGFRSRSRVCKEPNRCIGNSGEVDACGGNQKCEWSSWEKWSECSKKCGGGRRKRTGKCEEENQCSGNSTVVEDCNQDGCQWAAWNEWSACSKKCGGGRWNRSRICEEDNQCLGNSTEEEGCNQDGCQWSTWSQCLCEKYRHCPERNRCEGNREETIPNCDKPKCKGRLHGYINCKSIFPADKTSTKAQRDYYLVCEKCNGPPPLTFSSEKIGFGQKPKL